MTVKNQDPLVTMMGQLFDASTLNDSFVGKIAKNVIDKTLTSYVDANRANNSRTSQADAMFNKLSKKWLNQIDRDLSKLSIDENEKKLLLAMSLASIYTELISNK